MKQTEQIIQNSHEFLKYLKFKFSLYHKSNIFLRDVHYGVIHFLKEKNINVSHSKSEVISSEVLKYYEKENILKKIDSRTWMLNYEEFITPKAEKKQAETI
ncbi:MAG: hypothetical protein QME58_08285 [Bacteroidota bacterium]|nr:hypothetical protein [Bacteroidota bacterium]